MLLQGKASDDEQFSNVYGPAHRHLRSSQRIAGPGAVYTRARESATMSQSNPVSRLLVGPGGWAHENAMSPERYRATTATVIRPVVCLPGAGGVRQPEDFSIRRQLTH